MMYFAQNSTFLVQDIGNSKYQFLHLPISLGGAMLQMSVYGLSRYVSVTPTYHKNFMSLGETLNYSAKTFAGLPLFDGHWHSGGVALGDQKLLVAQKVLRLHAYKDSSPLYFQCPGNR